MRLLRQYAEHEFVYVTARCDDERLPVLTDLSQNNIVRGDDIEFRASFSNGDDRRWCMPRRLWLSTDPYTRAHWREELIAVWNDIAERHLRAIGRRRANDVRHHRRDVQHRFYRMAEQAFAEVLAQCDDPIIPGAPRAAPRLLEVRENYSAVSDLIGYRAIFSNGDERGWGFARNYLVREANRVEIDCWRRDLPSLYESLVHQRNDRLLRDATVRVAARLEDDMANAMRYGVLPSTNAPEPPNTLAVGGDINAWNSTLTLEHVRAAMHQMQAMADYREALHQRQHLTAMQVRHEQLEAQARLEQQRQRQLAGLGVWNPFAEENVRMEARVHERALAEKKGIKLLKSWLSPEQLQCYERNRFFEVIGSVSRTRYRIRHGCTMNIDELDAAGEKVSGWCFGPAGNLCTGDTMLAQKIALETNETEAMKVANQILLGGGLAVTAEIAEMLRSGPWFTLLRGVTEVILPLAEVGHCLTIVNGQGGYVTVSDMVALRPESGAEILRTPDGWSVIHEYECRRFLSASE